MRKLIGFLIFTLLGCSGNNTQQAIENLLGEADSLYQSGDYDKALIPLLDAVDMSKDLEDANLRFNVYNKVADVYESKALFSLQQDYQKLMLEETNSLNDRTKQAETMQRMALTSNALGDVDEALKQVEKAYQLAPEDTLDFRAQSLLLASQFCMAQEITDSAETYLRKAEEVWPKVIETDLYRLTNVYLLSTKGMDEEIERRVSEYMPMENVFSDVEISRFLLYSQKNLGNTNAALATAERMLEFSDSIRQMESSESTARIHELQHENQQQRHLAEMASTRSRFLLVTTIVLTLLLISAVLALVYRKRSIVAHEKELEAMRLAEVAQYGEEQARQENVALHKRYYEHLYAIILPILNARRSKSGHIDLEENSWVLIEKNTDMVLPHFTSRLRRSHPNLSVEDIRFCCLIAMRVPNGILADVYGIAVSSVAVRKQRMKKKLDTLINEQTLESYLGQFGM